MGPTIIWFRNDLRIDDNRALSAAVKRGEPLIPLYIWAPEEEGDWQPGSASRWWLQRSLSELNEQLVSRNCRLIVRHGSSGAVLKRLIAETKADAVYFNRRYEKYSIERDRFLTIELEDSGIAVETFNASLLIEPWEIYNNSGKPFRVFTPFWNRAIKVLDAAGVVSLDPPATIYGANDQVDSVGIDLLDSHLDRLRSSAFETCWQPGTTSAQAQLDKYLDDGIADYAQERNSPDFGATSCLSPRLHFGELSPRQIWSAVKFKMGKSKDPSFNEACTAYLRQLGWREFAYHLIYHFPKTTSKPLQTKFESFPWTSDQYALSCWQNGQTGYPIVDAGMRQLSQTGWINNRMRLIVSSFLAKDLLMPWQEGARWFFEKLVDADLANNTLGWQWIAGCGADAAPFFRIFNPVTQGQKFDPNGEYIRRFVPELSKLPRKLIHEPWRATQAELDAAEVTMGVNYPQRIIDHDMARRRALEMFRSLGK